MFVTQLPLLEYRASAFYPLSRKRFFYGKYMIFISLFCPGEAQSFGFRPMQLESATLSHRSCVARCERSAFVNSCVHIYDSGN